MNISINLLPEDLKITKRNEKRKSLIVKSSIGLLIVMVVITSVLFFLVLLDSFKIKQETQRLEDSKNRVAALKNSESLAAILKNRLDSIKAIQQLKSPQEDSFNLMLQIVPPEVKILTLIIDKKNQIILTGESFTTKPLESFFNNLTDPKNNDGKIASTKVNSLSRSQNNLIRFDLQIAIR